MNWEALTSSSVWQDQMTPEQRAKARVQFLNEEIIPAATRMKLDPKEVTAKFFTETWDDLGITLPKYSGYKQKKTTTMDFLSNPKKVLEQLNRNIDTITQPGVGNYKPPTSKYPQSIGEKYLNREEVQNDAIRMMAGLVSFVPSLAVELEGIAEKTATRQSLTSSDFEVAKSLVTMPLESVKKIMTVLSSRNSEHRDEAIKELADTPFSTLAGIGMAWGVAKGGVKVSDAVKNKINPPLPKSAVTGTPGFSASDIRQAPVGGIPEKFPAPRPAFAQAPAEQPPLPPMGKTPLDVVVERPTGRKLEPTTPVQVFSQRRMKDSGIETLPDKDLTVSEILELEKGRSAQRRLIPDERELPIERGQMEQPRNVSELLGSPPNVNAPAPITVRDIVEQNRIEARGENAIDLMRETPAEPSAPAVKESLTAEAPKEETMLQRKEREYFEGKKEKERARFKADVDAGVRELQKPSSPVAKTATTPAPVAKAAPTVELHAGVTARDYLEAAKKLGVKGVPIIAPPVETTGGRIVPKVSNVATKGGVFDEFRDVFAPAGRDVASKFTAGVMREEGSRMARALDKADDALYEHQIAFDKKPPEYNFGLIDKIETAEGRDFSHITDIKEREFASAMADALDGTRDEIIQLGKELDRPLLNEFYENYFPHIWKDPAQAHDVIASMLSKKPLEGQKSFLKKRSIATIREGRELGLEPVSPNPVDMVMTKLTEMKRFVFAQNVLKAMKDEGLMKFVKHEKDAPSGWATINDRISNVTYRNDAGELVIAGKYFVPKSAAKVINNYLSPGLGGSKVFRGWRTSGNLLNQAQLGVSAFHLGFTSMESIISKVALVNNALSRGDVKTAVIKGIQAPVAPIENFLRGNKLYKAWINGTTDPIMSNILNGLIAGGGRVKMDSFYRTNITRNMKRAFAQGNIGGGMFRIPGAILEQVSKPIMEIIVPRQKLGVFMDLMDWELKQKPNMTPIELRATSGKIWDSVDNRMGQLVYDNLFWNKIAKDLGFVGVRSLGWNLGTFRELGGGAIDIGKNIADLSRGKGTELSYRSSYLISLPIVTGVTGAILNYLMTGDMPGYQDGKETGNTLKDMYFPRTGRKTLNGDDDRISLPTYMKDIYHYGKAPLETLSNKLHPLIGMTAEMLDNKDFYGNKIANEDDPLMKQILSETGYIGKSTLPFAYRGLERNLEQGESKIKSALPFIGLTPAPATIVRTPAQNLAYEYSAEQQPIGGRTQEQSEKSKRKSKLRGKVRSTNEGIPQELVEEFNDGKLSEDEVYDILKSRYESPLQRSLSSLPIDKAINVYRIANDAEKANIRDDILQKMYRVVADGSIYKVNQVIDMVLKDGLLDVENLNDPEFRLELDEYKGGKNSLDRIRKVTEKRFLRRSEKIEGRRPSSIELEKLKAHFNRITQ